MKRLRLAFTAALVLLVGAFGRGEVDVLVGTQMIAKGLDFPGVVLVGVVSADLSLQVPDFRAAERTFQLVSPSDDLRENPENQLATPPLSSWGSGGYAHMWLDGSNDWIYRHLHNCARHMVGLARDFPDATALQRRALNQAARELLLA